MRELNTVFRFACGGHHVCNYDSDMTQAHFITQYQIMVRLCVKQCVSALSG